MQDIDQEAGVSENTQLDSNEQKYDQLCHQTYPTYETESSEEMKIEQTETSSLQCNHDVDETQSEFDETEILNSEHLKRLNLNYGPNEAKFRISTQYQGTAECKCMIYLWNFDDKIVISDIDGTITKSDVLGHILPLFGIDWTHPHIVRIYDKIARNNYRFVYLSSRSHALYQMTQFLLKSVRHGDCRLPDGPIMLYPQPISHALYVELIKRRADIYKAQCLRTVCSLFDNQNAVVSAFGNRPTDIRAYEEAGLKDSQLFTVFHNGDVIQGYPKDYHDSTKSLMKFELYDSGSLLDLQDFPKIFSNDTLLDFADCLWPPIG